MIVDNEITRDQRGFTLIEVMVALAIFAIGIVACYTMQVRSSGTTIRANSVSTSANWATYNVEGLLAEHYINASVTSSHEDQWENNKGDDPGNGSDDIDDTDQPGDKPDGVMHISTDGSASIDESNVTSGDHYTVFWNVADDTPLEGVKHIRVIVKKNRGLNSGVLYSHDFYKTLENEL